MKKLMVVGLMLMSTSVMARGIMHPAYRVWTDINGVEYIQCANDYLVSKDSNTSFVEPVKICGDKWTLPSCEDTIQQRKEAKVVEQAIFEKYKAIVGQRCENNHFDKIHGISIR